MISVSELLDRARSRAGLASDYKLAVTLGCSPSSIGNYRNGKTLPDERMLMKLCELSGDDPALVVVELQAMRASGDAARLWQLVAARLMAPQTAKIALAVLAVLVANFLGVTDTYADTLPLLAGFTCQTSYST